MRFRRFLPLVSALALGITVSAPAGAIIVERVVAVVGDKPILLSELEVRTRPFKYQVSQKVPVGPQRAAAHDQINREMLQKMIDEELEAQAADRAKVSVTPDEIDNAFKTIAGSQNMTVSELFREARTRSGLSEQEYRDEIRRQILEGKMIQLRVKGRVRITKEDVRLMYERFKREERKVLEYHPAWIVLRIMPGSSPAARVERQALAQTIAARAAAGEDFAALAKLYSDDTQTKEVGGDLGIRAPLQSPAAQQGKRPTLGKELEEEVMKLDTNQVSPPVRTEQAIFVLKLVSRQPSRFKTYDEAEQEMLGRLQQEILEKAKRKWLDELKAKTHLDVRL
jgi:peptidyl-prolyl cis-trans isomerase SurA